MKKVRLALVAVVAAMSLMGGAYAYWSQTLFAQGDVGSSNLYANISNLRVAYTGNERTLAGTKGDNRCEGFPYGAATNDSLSLSASPAGEDFVNPEVDNNYNTVNVGVTGAWPGYDAIFTFDVSNDGSVPWQVDGNNAFTFTLPDGTTLPSWCEVNAYDVTGLVEGGGSVNDATVPINPQDYSGDKYPGVKLLGGEVVCPNQEQSLVVAVVIHMPWGTQEDDSSMNGNFHFKGSLHLLQSTTGNGQ